MCLFGKLWLTAGWQEAFWLLVQLLNKFGIAGLFTSGMPTAAMMLSVMKPLTAKFMPRLAEKMVLYIPRLFLNIPFFNLSLCVWCA